MRVRGLLPLALVLSTMIHQATAQPAPPAPPEANPLLREWKTPFGVPPFGDIRPEHFLPAFREAIAAQRREIEAIASNAGAPTFDNTIVALDRAGSLLEKVAPVFSNLQSANTTPELQAINREVAPQLSALRDDVRMHPALFARVKAVWERRDAPGLTPVQRRLVEETYKGFVRGGANLDAAAKARLREVNAELVTLGVKFGDNLLQQTNGYRLVIDREADLAGLPSSVVAAGAEAAAAAGLAGKWVYTLQAPSIWPFLDYADTRDLRRQIFTAYTTRGDRGDAFDNKALLARTAALRAERAAIMGYTSHAAFVLEENMAKSPDQVYALLNRLWEPAVEVARREAADLQQQVAATGGTFAIEPWDWRYYAEKVRKARYDLDDQALRPYFPLEQVRDGAFHVANRLYGITVTPRPDLPAYHPEVKAFEVKDADGSHLGVFYTDYHPRAGKRVGAWSSRFRGQRLIDGRHVRPVVVNVCNFSRPAGDAPALLSLDEVETLFHEFGHALHSLLAQVPYQALSGTPRDFVELPSQIMENWALEPEVLKVYARHYRTGEPIPMALVAKLGAASRFNQGFATVEYLAASIIDMDWHTLAAGPAVDPIAFEQKTLSRIGMPAQIVPRYRSPYFNHVFGPGGGYAAGYYSYIWSEVLDADAFSAFEEKGLFDPATAKAFRTQILEKGGTEEAAALYRAFRGREPDVAPLLAKRGLKKAGTN